MNKIFFFLAATSVVGGITLAQANVYTPPGAYVPLSVDGWNDTFTLHKFNSNLGTLTGIELILTQDIHAYAVAENKTSKKQNVTLTLNSDLTMTDQYGVQIVSSTPILSTVVALKPFDGTLDFSGSSSSSYEFTAQPYITSQSTDDPTYLSLYSAPGDNFIYVTTEEVNYSNAKGTGNLASNFTTETGGSALLIYTYTPPVPEPETYAMLLAGLGLMAFTLHARKRS